MKKLIIVIGILAASVSLHAQTPTPIPAVTPPSILDPAALQNTIPIPVREATEKRRLITVAQQFDANVRNQFALLYNGIWKNPQGLTPQQVCDGLGPLAAQLFVYAGTLSGPLNVVHPGIVPAGVPDGYTVTPHADGTVTITYTAPTPTPTPTPENSPAPVGSPTPSP